MKAVIIDEFGGPEVLRVGDRDLPEPGAGQVRVRVRAAGVNGIDAAIRSGAAQEMFPTELPMVLGLEHVRALGVAEFIDAAELTSPAVLALYDAVYRPHLPVRYDVIDGYLVDSAVLRNALDSLLERVFASNRGLTDDVPINVVRNTV